MIDQTTFDLQKLTDLAVAVSAKLLCKPDHRKTLIIIILLACLIAQGAAGNPKNITCPSLGCAELLTRLNNRTT